MFGHTTILNTALCRVRAGVVVSAPGESRSAIVTAVLHAEGCCKRSLALSAKLSAELDGAEMLAASEEVTKTRRLVCVQLVCVLYLYAKEA